VLEKDKNDFYEYMADKAEQAAHLSREYEGTLRPDEKISRQSTQTREADQRFTRTDLHAEKWSEY
jgi:hypothetical protein